MIFTATIRAIQEVGKVEVLSRPTIMARNNQQATVVVGQQVPIISGVTYDTFGNEHSSITYQNVGVILQVTPFITSDNKVEMILAPQISSVASQSTLISSGTNGNFSTPYINIESANTVVVTPNGQTVAIGGMMQDNKTTTDSKIPLLGDIPGLGLLFHHKVNAVNKTELIIFLTPYVIRTPDDLVQMTVDEKSRADMAPKAFSEKEYQHYLAPQPPAAVPATARLASRAPITILDIMMTRRTWAVYGMLAAIWAMLIGWQTAEHVRARQLFQNMVVERGRSISTTCGLLMRARSFFGVVSRERLEAALNELVNTNELRSVQLLNSDGEAVASAGVPFELPRAQ